jgi:hypothetical protein
MSFGVHFLNTSLATNHVAPIWATSHTSPRPWPFNWEGLWLWYGLLEFALALPLGGGSDTKFWQTMKHDHIQACRNPCRLVIHDFLWARKPSCSNVKWFGRSRPFWPTRDLRVGWHGSPILNPKSLEVHPCNSCHWAHGRWDLPLHTRSQVLTPKCDTNAYMTTLFGSEAQVLRWAWGRPNKWPNSQHNPCKCLYIK